jgi:tRNA threonylcarbamoyladenosine biosynthesis protein TsaE
MEFRVSLDDIQQFAHKFWDHIGDAKVFAFHGQMGSGKTTLISALAHARGTKDVTASPTFSIINEYALPGDDNDSKFYHIDLYRLKDEEEVINAGVEDCMYSGSVCMVEWPEKALHLFDENTVHVFVDVMSDRERVITIKKPRASSHELRAT